MRNEGIDLEVSSLLGDDYLETRFHGGSLPWLSLVDAGKKRLRQLRRRDHDVAMLHCELFPLLPALLERRIMGGMPYVYDFDDAFYLRYRHGRLAALKPILGGKFDAVMSGAAAVTAGNATLQDYANQHNSNVTLLPTVVDTDRYSRGSPSRDGVFTVGWIGSPSTAPYLEQLRPCLELLAKEAPLRLVVIGGRAPAVRGAEVVEKPWREDAEVGDIQQFDVGVMPLADDEWARGKCAFKLIQYMACGVPVIGSRVGANEVVVDASCGFLPGSDEEWAEALRTIRDNRRLAKAMGDASRVRVEEHYSLRRNLPILAQVIHHASSK